MSFKTSVIACFVLITAGALGAAAFITGWANGQPASNVIGQTALDGGGPGTSQTKLSGPSDVAVDPNTGKIFVADSQNNRVMRFATAAAFTNGAAAEIVLGQANFGSSVSSAAANGMNWPSGVAVDAGGRLWVADRDNNRVLRFDNASTITSGAAANGVLGQTSLTSNFPGSGLEQMSVPRAVSVDLNGRLWVSDASNNRVLRFDSAATLADADGASASGFLGTGTTGCVANRFTDPAGVFADNAGRLWVGDYGNLRILRFDGAASKTNSANADGVIGQTNLTTCTFGTSQSTLSFPWGVTVDAFGRLYVSDTGNNRVLIFNFNESLTNGPQARNVLGQPDFTSSSSSPPTANTFFGPVGLTMLPGTENLLLADAVNGRVLRFAPAGNTAAGVSVSGRVLTDTGRGLTNARVTITDPAGYSQTVVTGRRGTFAFEGVEAGQTYIISVGSRRFAYEPQPVAVTDNVSGLTLYPIGSGRSRTRSVSGRRP